MTMDSNLMLVILMILALLAVAVFLQTRRHVSHALERRFGPEYEHAIAQLGSLLKAQAEPKARPKRAEQLRLRALSPADAARLNEAWKSLQTRFVDRPKGSLVEADMLVRELMEKRGYPMGDFERRAADISVDHPGVVDRYCAAHELALRDRRGNVDTERMRQAVIHYRALFAELLVIESEPAAHAHKLRTST